MDNTDNTTNTTNTTNTDNTDNTDNTTNTTNIDIPNRLNFNINELVGLLTNTLQTIENNNENSLPENSTNIIFNNTLDVSDNIPSNIEENIDSDDDIPPLIDLDNDNNNDQQINISIQMPPPPPQPLNLYNFRFPCDICGQQFNDELAVQDHKMIAHDNLFDDLILKCNSCNRTFIYEDDLNNHRCIQNPIIRHEYKCDICNEVFSNQYLLGDHILNDHNSYDALNILDNKSTVGYFPGFNILDKIGMISNIEYKKFKEYYKYNDTCDLCLEKYDFISEQINKDDHYIINKKTKNKYENFNCDMKLLDFKEKKVNPYILNCCKKYLCDECISNYCNSSNSLKCAYCFKDHTREDLDYIKFIDEDEKIDKTRWRKWWEKHIDIFL